MASNYGSAFAPQMQEPYSIESTLAPLAVGSSQAEAQTMLDQYWLERQVREADYKDQYMDQRAFQHQQLAAQMADNAWKAASEASKQPGMLDVIRQMNPQYFEGVDPSTWSTAANAASAAAAATNLEHAGAGVNSMSQAGYGIPIPAVQGITGIQGITPQTPRDIQIANINAAARLGAASLHAATGKLPHMSVTEGGAGEAPQGTTSYPPGWDLATINKYRASQGQMPLPIPNVPAPAQPGTPVLPPPKVPVTPGAPAKTNLPSAPPPGSAPAGLSSGSTILPTDSKEGQNMQNSATIAIERLRQKGVDVSNLQPKGTTVHTIYKSPDGSYTLIGRDGKPAMRLPPAQSK